MTATAPAVKMVLPEDRELVKFADVPVGDYFIDDWIVFEKLDDTLARGPKLRPLGTGVYEFEADAEVEPC